jgi:hypothetical protein
MRLLSDNAALGERVLDHVTAKLAAVFAEIAAFEFDA